MSDITFIIPNYNGVEVLSQNLPKIISLAQKYHAKIIVIDDCSKDNSVQMLKEKFADQIVLITKDKNEGFSSTVNLGAQHATTELLFMLNSDAVPHPDALEHVLPYFDNPKTFAVGLKDIDDEKKYHGQGKFIFHQGFLLHQGGDGRADEKGNYRTGWVSCGSGIFRRSIWNELGGLDTLYNPFYFEDVDLGYRSWKSGYQNYFEPKALCDHLHKKGAIKSNYNDERIRTISIRNQFLFTWLNLTNTQLLSQHLMQLPKNILIAIKNNDTPFLRGMIEATRKLSEVKIHRVARQKYRTLTDNELLQLVS